MTDRIRTTRRVRLEVSSSALTRLPNQRDIGRVYEEEHAGIKGHGLRRQFADRHPSRENGSRDIESKCAKLNHSRREVASRAKRNW